MGVAGSRRQLPHQSVPIPGRRTVLTTADFIVMYFIWRNWRTMVSLRSRWFRSPAYQHKIYSRTLMVTQIRKDYRSDAGLLALMGQLKVDGIKIGPEIDCTSIGMSRRTIRAVMAS